MTTPFARFAPPAGLYRLAGAAILITMTAHTSTAHASRKPSPDVIGHCRTDPVVLLSDGTRLTVTATIAGTKRDMRAVTYTIHVPAGVSLAGLTFPSDGQKMRETVHVYADNRPATYDVATMIDTRTATQAVIHMHVVTANGRQAAATSTGVGHRTISTRVTMTAPASPHAPHVS